MIMGEISERNRFVLKASARLQGSHDNLRAPSEVKSPIQKVQPLQTLHVETGVMTLQAHSRWYTRCCVGRVVVDSRHGSLDVVASGGALTPSNPRYRKGPVRHYAGSSPYSSSSISAAESGVPERHPATCKSGSSPPGSFVLRKSAKSSNSCNLDADKVSSLLISRCLSISVDDITILLSTAKVLHSSTPPYTWDRRRYCTTESGVTR